MIRRSRAKRAIPLAGAGRLVTLAALASLAAAACGESSASKATSDITTSSSGEAMSSTTLRLALKDILRAGGGRNGH